MTEEKLEIEEKEITNPEEIQALVGDDDLVLKGEVINLIRTTQRNYINLTNIADNKANILISINALMLTILLPIFFTSFDFIINQKLQIPIFVFALTCLLTIVLASLVITPFRKKVISQKPMFEKKERSPFFFAEYDDLTFDQYELLLKNTVKDKKTISQIIARDLYQFGLTLSSKYSMIKKAYTLFYNGIIVSFILFLIFLYI
ncbi:MAG TPA: DUF5706 domain-containing protein [Saprospiraceae bacterium]|nr:DUF5706 domain-containing protein [Saprospiraceae bacterium]